MNTTTRSIARRRLLPIALLASLPLLIATAPRLHAQQTDMAQERGAPQPVPPPVAEHEADAVDHARDGLPPPPQQGSEDPMSSPPPPAPKGAMQQPARPAMWAQLDRDGDGMISASEARANADFSTRFASMDRNGDGFVSDAEYRVQDKGMDQDRS